MASTNSSKFTLDVSARLPPELLHIIFSNADKSTLSSCSLVAHAWLNFARRYLFDSIHYRTRSDIRNPAAERSPPFLDLLAFLEKTPLLRPHIHALSLEMKIRRHTAHSIQRGERFLRSASLDVLYAILRLIPNLRTLKTRNVYFGDLSPAQTPPFSNGPALNRLESLFIDDQYLSHHFALPPNRALQLVSFFGSVNDFKFHRSSCEYRDQVVHTAGPSRTRVRDLHVNRAIGACDFSMIDFDYLESYSFEGSTAKTTQMARIAQFLATAGHNLRRVKLPILGTFVIFWKASGHLEVNRLAHPRLTQLDLSSLRKVESICFALHAYASATHTDGVGMFTPAYAFIIRALSSLPGTLHSLTLELRWESTVTPDRFRQPGQTLPENIVQMDWSELDDMLARRVSERGLHTVQITLEQFPQSMVTKSCIEAALTQTNATGALALVVRENISCG